MSASFMPELIGYTGQGPFRFWCQKVLPLVYDDSLSYYEVLNKIVVYLNNTISDVGNVETNVENLHTAYGQLQSYVNEHIDDVESDVESFKEYVTTYLQNLNVQDEINTKLDEMATSGELGQLLLGEIYDPQNPGNSLISQLVSDWLNDAITGPAPGEAVAVDGTLSISGAAADAKVTGDEIRDVKSGLNNAVFNVTVSESPIAWESGTINSTGGGTQENTKRIRTNAFSKGNIFSFVPKDGYRIELAGYDANSVYMGMWNGVAFEKTGAFTSNEIFTKNLPANYMYKLVLDSQVDIDSSYYTNCEFKYIKLATVENVNALEEKINDTNTNLEDFVISGEAEFQQSGNDINFYISSNGQLREGNINYKSKWFEILPGKTYKINTTGNRLIYGLYNELTDHSNAILYENKTEEIGTDQYITNMNAPYLVVYYDYLPETPGDAEVFLIIAPEDEERKNHFNILIFGNSYAADAWGYVPFILKKYGITVNIYMYYRGSGSPSRLVQEWEDTSETGFDIYGGSHIRRMTHIDTRTDTKWASAVSGYSAKNILEFVNDPTRNIDKWDIITLQPVSSEQYSDGNGGWTMGPGLEPAFREVINLINASYSDTYTLGFFETYNRYRPIGGVPVSALDNRIETMKANEASYKAEPFDLLLPVGAAVFSARTNSLLASLEISDMTNLWASDKTHLQEGVPCYLGALTICQAIFNKYYPKYSVFNDDTRITSALLSQWNVQFMNGTPKTASELAYQLAQKCAVVANEHPFDITPIYLPDDTAEILYDRAKYWADSLIDTSIVPDT